VSPPIRVFVGSGTPHLVEETVFAHSVLSQANREVSVVVVDASTHEVRDFGSDERRPLPEQWRGRLSGATAFSFARFGIPELCGYEGRAIYCEADQLALADVCDLWDHDLGSDALAAVPHEATRHPSPFQTSGHLSSVVLFDNARCRALGVVDIAERIGSGELEYQDAISMTDAFVDTLGLAIGSLHPRWNDLQVSCDDTAILHFTDMRHRPWLHPGLPDSDRWVRAYLSAVDAGLLQDPDLATARRLGAISLRIRTLPRLPSPVLPLVDHGWQTAEPVARRVRRRLRRSPRRWIPRRRVQPVT